MTDMMDKPLKIFSRAPLIMRLLRDEQGAAVIEFAFIGLILFTILFGLLEFSLIVISRNVMENAVLDASRNGLTGYTPGGSSREALIASIISRNSLLMSDPARLRVESLVYPELDDVGQPEPYNDVNDNGVYDDGDTFTDINGNGQWDSDRGRAGLGGANEVVLYIITYDWEILTPLMGQLMGEDGIVSLRTSMLVRNEPFTP